jgi:hypothetical protein
LPAVFQGKKILPHYWLFCFSCTVLAKFGKNGANFKNTFYKTVIEFLLLDYLQISKIYHKSTHPTVYRPGVRVSSFACFFCFAKHETKRNSSSVSRNFACFAKQNISRNFVSFRFVKSKISFRFAKFHVDLLRFATFVSFRKISSSFVSFR